IPIHYIDGKGVGKSAGGGDWPPCRLSHIMASMPHLIRTLPKVELHLHLETSLRLRRLLGQQHPDDPTIADPHLIADPGAFTGYDRLRRLRYANRAGRIPDEAYTTENITRITADLLAAAAADNVRYVEIRGGGGRGVPALAGPAAAGEPGGHGAFLVTVAREGGPEEGEAIVPGAAACRDLRVVGIDLAG